MQKRRVGAITIGQSPRVDITPELLPILGDRVDLIQVGALDGLTAAEITALAPAPGDSMLVSRLRDGAEARMRRLDLLPLIQGAFDSLEGRVDAILMLCTGSFPPFRTSHLVLYPEQLLFRVVQGICGEEVGGPLVGILTPDAGQIAEQRARWLRMLGQAPVVAPCSPYDLSGLEERLAAAARQLKAAGAGLIVMDCLGYSGPMKRIVAQEAGVPVVQARTVLGRVAAELLDDGGGTGCPS